MRFLPRFFEGGKDREEAFINDRRCAKRYKVLLKLNYSDPVSKCEGESLTRDISRTGLKFSVTRKIPKGTMLDLKIEDPNSSASISSKAKVIWMKELITGDDAGNLIYEVGVRLLKKRLY